MMNDVIKTIKTRRSVRSFKNQQISDEALNIILDAATYAPSGMNRQTWKFTAVQNKEKIENLASAVKTALDMPSDQIYNFYGSQTFIIVSNEKDNPTGFLDSAAALQTIFLAAKSLGIETCWINQLNHACDDPHVREMLTEFEVPENHVVWGCAALGFEVNPPKCPERKSGSIHIVK